jgi:DNA polymerase V
LQHPERWRDQSPLPRGSGERVTASPLDARSAADYRYDKSGGEAAMSEKKRGRPAGTGRYREPTQVMRVPSSQVAVVRGYLEQLRPLPGAAPEAAVARPVRPPDRRRLLPLMTWPVRAGFPSPAEDDRDDAIDLNELLAPRAEATFLLRVSGSSMTGAGIDDGDVLVVDRSLTADYGRIVVAVVDGEFTVKRLVRRDGKACLEASHPDFPPITLRDDQELAVWGVVTRVIKSV